MDLSSLVAGPLASQLLADLGAEVIRVEAPGSDPVRFSQPMNGDLAAGFEQHNRGKKSLSVDIKSAEGRGIVYRLVATADLFLQNSRPGVMERLGFGYDELRKINPRLIYASVSGFADSGPYAMRPAYDGVIQAMAGFMPVQGRDGEPMAIASPVVDKITAIFASHAMLAALLHRERTGEGQKVSINMLGAFAAFMLPDLMVDHSFASRDLPPAPRPDLMYQTLRTSDGVVLGLVLQRSQCEALLKALGREDLLPDPRFQTTQLIVENGLALYAEIAPDVQKLDTATFLAMAEEHGIAFGRVNRLEEFLDDPAIKQGPYFEEFEDPVYGTIRHIGHPAIFAKSPAVVNRRAPLLGEHNEELLAELAATSSG